MRLLKMLLLLTGTYLTTDVFASLAHQSRREKAFEEWTKFPSARYAHAQEDHFMPLHVIVGAAQNDKGRVLFRKDLRDGKMIFANWGFGVHD